MWSGNVERFDHLFNGPRKSFVSAEEFFKLPFRDFIYKRGFSGCSCSSSRFSLHKKSIVTIVEHFSDERIFMMSEELDVCSHYSHRVSKSLKRFIAMSLKIVCAVAEGKNQSCFFFAYANICTRL